MPACDREIKDQVAALFKLGDFSGKRDEVHVFYPAKEPGGQKFAARRVAFIGVGNIKKSVSDSELKEALRCAGGNIAKSAAKLKAASVSVALPSFSVRTTGGAQQIAEGILLGDYRFTKYKTKNEDKKFDGIQRLTFRSAKDSQSVRKLVRRAQHLAQAALEARNMANEPGNYWTPQQFGEYARALAKSDGLSCKVLEKNHIEKLGMGGLLAVNQGSATKPKVIVVEYTPQRYSRTILLVGKGITFDSGGVSLKPAAGMQDMKYDMCGGAAVLCTMQAVARLKPGVRVIGVVPSTDNMSGSSAVKPGDIVKHYNGVTGEVINTDAEGRLILADALAYGIEKYKPSCVVDLATLTGAVIIGLGHHRAGLLGNNDELAEQLIRAGETCGEPIWRLPLTRDDSKQIDSEVADIKNVGGKAGGTITAAAYLEKFVGSTPWAHLDIAGTAWDFTKKSYIPEGPSGFGVRTLVEFISNWKSLVLK